MNNVVNSTTGHSAKGERKVAGIIYMAIAIAVVVGLGIAFFMGQHREFNPEKAEAPGMTAPHDVPAEANQEQAPSQFPNQNAPAEPNQNPNAQ